MAHHTVDLVDRQAHVSCLKPSGEHGSSQGIQVSSLAEIIPSLKEGSLCIISLYLMHNQNTCTYPLTAVLSAETKADFTNTAFCTDSGTVDIITTRT